jgi:hypothetical protein
MSTVVKTTAKVVDHEVREDDSGRHYYAIYEYAGIRNAVVGGNAAQKHPPRSGEEAFVFYDPASPTNAFLEGSRAPWALPGCGIVLATLLLLVAIYVRFDPSH